MGRPSSLTPSAFSPPACARARSWCWTISVPTSVRTPTRPSRPSVAGSSSCRPPRRTSTRSSWPSPRAKSACALPPSAPPTACSPPPPWPSMPSRPWTPAASPPPAASPSRPSTMRTTLCVAQRSSGGLVAIARTLPMIAPRHWLLARGLLAVVVGLSASAPGLLPSQKLGDLGASAANDRVITAGRWRRLAPRQSWRDLDDHHSSQQIGALPATAPRSGA